MVYRNVPKIDPTGKVLYIWAGGTISCRYSDVTKVPKYAGREVLSHVPQLKELMEAGYIDVWDLPVDDRTKLDSTNLTHEMRQLMIRRSLQAYKDGYVGVAISQGTNSLANTSAYMALHLLWPDFAIAATAANMEIDAPDSDGAENLLDAFAAVCDRNLGLKGSYVVFDNEIHRGTRVSIVGEEGRHGYKSPHYPVIARRRNGRFSFTDAEAEREERRHQSRLENLSRMLGYPMLAIDYPRAVIKAVGHKKLVEDHDLEDFISGGEDKALYILEVWGTGEMPNIAEATLLPVMPRWAREGKVVIVTSRVPHDMVNLNTYGPAKEALQNGILPGRMLPDVCRTKGRVSLAIASRLNNGKYDPHLLKQLFLHPLESEVRSKLRGLGKYSTSGRSLRMNDEHMVDVIRDAYVADRPGFTEGSVLSLFGDEIRITPDLSGIDGADSTPAMRRLQEALDVAVPEVYRVILKGSRQPPDGLLGGVRLPGGEVMLGVQDAARQRIKGSAWRDIAPFVREVMKEEMPEQPKIQIIPVVLSPRRGRRSEPSLVRELFG